MAKAGSMGKGNYDKPYTGPLDVGAPAGEKGPQVNNPPVAEPADPLGYIPKGGK